MVKIAEDSIHAEPTRCLLFAAVDIHDESGVTVAIVVAAAAAEDDDVVAIAVRDDREDEMAKGIFNNSGENIIIYPSSPTCIASGIVHHGADSADSDPSKSAILPFA